jgi:hypothetical protein
VEKRVWQVAIADGLSYFRVLAQVFFLVEFFIELSFYWRSRRLRLPERQPFPLGGGWPLLHRLIFEHESLSHQSTSSNEEMTR